MDWISEKAPDTILQLLFEQMPFLGANVLEAKSRYLYELAVDLA